jgi:hypothetical protein
MMTKRGFLAMVAAGVSGLMVGSLGRQPAAVQAQAARPGPVGAWRSDIVQITGPRAGQPVVALFLFSSDGTMVQVNTDHPTRSPAVGVWSPINDRQFAWTFQRLIFDSNGNFTSYQKSRALVTMNSTLDEYTGNSYTEVIGVDGNLISDGNNQSTGKRMLLEAMPGSSVPTAAPGASPGSLFGITLPRP